jgi:hypothetical protein
MARYYFKIQDQDGVLQPDRGFDFSDAEHAKDEAKLLLTEMALDGLPCGAIASISDELQDANRVPIFTFRLIMDMLLHDPHLS